MSKSPVLDIDPGDLFPPALKQPIDQPPAQITPETILEHIDYTIRRCRKHGAPVYADALQGLRVSIWGELLEEDSEQS